MSVRSCYPESGAQIVYNAALSASVHQFVEGAIRFMLRIELLVVRGVHAVGSAIGGISIIVIGAAKNKQLHVPLPSLRRAARLQMAALLPSPWRHVRL